MARRIDCGGAARAAGPPPGAAAPAGDRHRELLVYVVRHGMVTPPQLAARFGATPAPPLAALTAEGLISIDSVLVGLPPVVRATARGTRASGCDLRPASLDLARVLHSLALVDLSEELLAAHRGSSWTTERELRRDRMREARREGHWDPQRRFPDGLLRLADGLRAAVELDLTPKRSARLDLLAGAYAVDRDVDAVWWYLPSARSVARMRALVAERGLDAFIEPRHRPLPPARPAAKPGAGRADGPGHRGPRAR